MLERKPRRPLINAEFRRKGIYLLPNLFTTAALFAGFYAIVQGMNQRFDQAAVAIFVAMVLDGLDGRGRGVQRFCIRQVVLRREGFKPAFYASPCIAPELPSDMRGAGTDYICRNRSA